MYKIILTAIIAALASGYGIAQEAVKLPDFGSSAGAIASPAEERNYGRHMLRQMRGLDMLLDDPLSLDFIESMGFKLVAQSEKAEQEFTFFIMRSEDINAFAAPGGYIGTNAGLITAAETESEIAAVLAHEVAHVTQRHMLRSFESAQKATLPIALGILGALVIASTSSSSSSGEAAQAAVVGGMGLIQQQQINFTRHNETEADRLGIHTLAMAGYEPDAMADFFAALSRAMRGNGDQVPEFLRTHPVNTSRITESKARAESARAEAKAAKSTKLVPSTGGPLSLITISSIDTNKVAQTGTTSTRMPFSLFRERVRALAFKHPTDGIRYYQKMEADAKGEWLSAYQYGRAICLIRANQAKQALPILQVLYAAHPNQLAYSLGYADALSRAGDSSKATEILEKNYHSSPDNRAITNAYAEELIRQTTIESSKRAIEILRLVLNRAPDNPALVFNLARAYEISGDTIRAAEMHAEVALQKGSLIDAKLQLEHILKRDDLSYYQRARIEARIAEIMPYALEQIRREHGSVEDRRG